MDFQTFLTIFLLLIIFLLILSHYWVHGTRMGQFVDKIPGPKWYPIIGNTFDILVPPENLWHFFRRSSRDFYPVYKYWAVNFPSINIVHPDDVEILLRDNKNISKSVFYELAHPWLNEGLITSTEDKWRARRKMITPAFHSNNLHKYSHIIIAQTEHLIASLKEEAKYGDVDKELLPMVSRFTLNTICETIMGTTFVDNDSSQDSYRRSIFEFNNIFYFRLFRPWLKNNWIFSQTSKGRDQSNAVKILHEFTTNIIKERRQYHNEVAEKSSNDFAIPSSKNNTQQSVDKRQKERLDLLDVLIDASKRGLGIDNQGIREEVDTFVFAGHDTSAVNIFFTILLLADHKEIQARARDEIDTILKESNGKMTINEVQRFSYLERCIKESLRLYPSVPIISRKITEDIQLKHCFVPKDSTLAIHIFDVHRDPNFWPRPNIYDPDRFLPERSEGRHPFSYIPFSGGLRNCIGKKFAMLEIITVIAGLLHNFYFEPLEVTANIRILPNIVLKPAHPVYVKFVPIIK